MELKFQIKNREEVFRNLTIDTSGININTIIVRTSKGFQYNQYEVELSEEIKDFCWDFSSRIITTGNQYNRLDPYWASSEEEEKLIKIQRTYCGKLAEITFLILLYRCGKEVCYHDMFEIFDGQENTDSYDFIARNNESIDVKAAFREKHKLLAVNCNQLNNIPKDYYVGVKLDASDKDSSKKVINSSSITKATIYGYSDRRYLSTRETVNLGEGDCKAVELERLMSIDRLIKLF